MVGITAAFWPIFYIEVIDLVVSFLGKNGKIYKSYAKSIAKDFVIGFFSAIALAIVYWLDVVPYSLSGVDLAFVGIPFLLSGIYNIIQSMNIKIAGRPINKIPFIIILTIIFFYLFVFIFLLIKNSSGELNKYQSLYLQSTILFFSFYVFTSTSLQLHMLTKGKLERSSFKAYFMTEVLNRPHGAYNNLEEPLNKTNKQIQISKAIQSASIRKKQKKV
jgi:hypothetical protein